MLPINCLSLLPLKEKNTQKLPYGAPKTKDLQAIDKKEGVEQTIAMIARLSEWPHEAISELDINDLSKIGEILESFIKRRETSTGKPPLN